MHNYENLQLDIQSNMFVEFGKQIIPDSILFIDETDPSYGRELNSHITLCYGGDKNYELDYETFFASKKSIECMTGELSLFKTDNYDVVILKLSDDFDLKKLNFELRRKYKFPGSTFPDYVPHLTLAYVLPNTMDARIKKLKFPKTKITFNAVTLSKQDGSTLVYELLNDTTKIVARVKGSSNCKLIAIKELNSQVEIVTSIGSFMMPINEYKQIEEEFDKMEDRGGRVPTWEHYILSKLQ